MRFQKLVILVEIVIFMENSSLDGAEIWHVGAEVNSGNTIFEQGLGPGS